jgi:hypothetical protein
MKVCPGILPVSLVAGFVSTWMVGEWLGVDDGRRRTKSYWWSGGFAAARQAGARTAGRQARAQGMIVNRPPASRRM